MQFHGENIPLPSQTNAADYGKSRSRSKAAAVYTERTFDLVANKGAASKLMIANDQDRS